MRIGIDIGSLCVKIVLVDLDNKICQKSLFKHQGLPLKAIIPFLENLDKNAGISLNFTGSGGEFFARITGTDYVNEIIAQAKAIKYFYPQVKTIIEIGGVSTKLIFSNSVVSNESNCGYSINDFATNSICAAGTGSFLDQQAKRLGLSIEDFGQLALRAKSIPRIAGRCSVFAKTDMIHLQQRATPLEEIVAGLCFALVRNFQGTLLRGKKIHLPVVFHGGVAANPGIIRALKEIFKLEDGELIIPEEHFYLNAFGATLFSEEKKISLSEVIEKLKNYQSPLNEKKQTRQPLSEIFQSPSHPVTQSPITNYQVNAYLGVDVGSISTNLVVIDEEKNVLAKCYLWTAGRPLEAIRQGLSKIGARISEKIKICGVCTTGSGRYLTADFLGADIVKNEITAQARAAIEIDPTVDTVFEIGGQDSKFISLENGAVIDFQMNKVCAAGTGSFLEEQAERLGIKIEQEFSQMALKAETPLNLGERCTVFMEEDLVHRQQRGAKKENLIAGLCYSIVENYLNRVVGEKKIGKNIFFQGGVAFNQGVVAAFKKVLSERSADSADKFTVPQHHEVTGALGCALIARENARSCPASAFKGFDLVKRKYELKSFECQDCANHCEISQVIIEGEKPLYYGSRCEKYEISRLEINPALARKGGADLFKEREKLLLSSYHSTIQSHASSAGHPPLRWDSDEDVRRGDHHLTKRIGIPRIFTFFEFYPFFSTFFSELGFKVILSDPTNQEITNLGLESVPVESCLPHKVAHGHILNLLNKNIDYLFLPSIISLPATEKDISNSFTCPYVQTLPYVIKASLSEQLKNKEKIKILQPVLYLGEEERFWLKRLKGIGEQLGCNAKQVAKAFMRALEAQKNFSLQMKKLGQETLDKLPADAKAIVIVGRPYNSCDAGLNLQLAKKILNLGILPIPLDYLPIESKNFSQEFPNMYWIFGQRFLAAAEMIKNDPRLYALYLTNFACGPDSFILKYFRDKISPKPFLEIEIDEHSSDVGLITRLEAFLDSVENQKSKIKNQKLKFPHPTSYIPHTILHLPRNSTLYIPNMCDHAYALAAAFQAFGINAEVLPESDEETLSWGKKYTLGRECYPYILTTGDMVKVVKNKDFDPKTTAFFMPSGCGPCRFGQYNYSQRSVLKELGYPEVSIYAPNQDENIFRDLGIVGGNGFVRLAWQGIVAVDILFKILLQTRPYEINPALARKGGVNPGESERVYQESLKEICRTIKEKGNPVTAMKKIKEKFKKIALHQEKKKPRIGIVGEIYIRSNRFSNHSLIHILENLGAEVYLTPTMEWLFYVNYLNQRRAWKKKKYSEFLSFWIKEKYQEYDVHRLEPCFRNFLHEGKEPQTKKILNYASPYLHSSYEGEAILSIGKSIDLLRNEISGIINVMPFTCMPGTIVSAILKKIKEEYPGLPCSSIAYDEQEDPFTKTKLEAFLHQADEYSRRDKKKFFVTS